MACTDSTNPSCPNFDSCLLLTETSAEFIIEQELVPFFPSSKFNFIQGEDKFGMGNLRFSAKYKADSYKWYLGSEVITDSTFTRTFSPSLSPFYFPVEISLVTRKSPSSSCFPNDDGFDSVSRVFTLVRICDFAINNRFYGSWESNPQDSFFIDIDLFDPFDSLGDECIRLRISNMDNSNFQNCDQWVFSNTYRRCYNFLELTIDGTITNTCRSPYGWIWVEPDGKVKMEYYLAIDTDGNGSLDDHDTIPKIFNGHVH